VPNEVDVASAHDSASNTQSSLQQLYWTLYGHWELERTLAWNNTEQLRTAWCDSFIVKRRQDVIAPAHLITSSRRKPILGPREAVSTRVSARACIMTRTWRSYQRHTRLWMQFLSW